MGPRHFEGQEVHFEVGKCVVSVSVVLSVSVESAMECH